MNINYVIILFRKYAVISQIMFDMSIRIDITNRINTRNRMGLFHHQHYQLFEVNQYEKNCRTIYTNTVVYRTG